MEMPDEFTRRLISHILSDIASHRPVSQSLTSEKYEEMEEISNPYIVRIQWVYHRRKKKLVYCR